MMQYRTKQNDILDDIAFRFYGDTDRLVVESIFEANRAIGLADLGAILPEGITIDLPSRDETVETETLTRLWD